jgi:pimeloyl-ACP methyl ester carboxylesterase
MVDLKLTQKLERHEIVCSSIGPVDVYIQGARAPNEVIILTVHDLGCDHTMYLEFVEHPKMAAIRNRTVWVHVNVPGQGQDAKDLPNEYVFPSMQQIGEDLVDILNQLKIKEVICFGEGAGANILARFAMAHIQRVLGVCLLHTTGSAAGLLESLKDKFKSWKLDTIGINPNFEAYLVLHRFGATKFSKANDKEELKAIVQGYQDALRNKANAKNLKKFVEAFLKRTSIADGTKKLNCPVLLVTGQQSIFNETTRQLHQAILKTSDDKAKVEFIEVGGVANVLEEKPDKLVECFQYFLQGLGLVSSVPMQNVVPQQRGRSMSMQDYDIPLRQRMNSAQLSYSPPISCSPPASLDGNRSGAEGSASGSPNTPNTPDSKAFAQQQTLLSSN